MENDLVEWMAGLVHRIVFGGLVLFLWVFLFFVVAGFGIGAIDSLSPGFEVAVHAWING